MLQESITLRTNGLQTKTASVIAHSIELTKVYSMCKCSLATAAYLTVEEVVKGEKKKKREAGAYLACGGLSICAVILGVAFDT